MRLPHGIGLSFTYIQWWKTVMVTTNGWETNGYYAAMHRLQSAWQKISLEQQVWIRRPTHAVLCKRDCGRRWERGRLLWSAWGSTPSGVPKGAYKTMLTISVWMVRFIESSEHTILQV